MGLWKEWSQETGKARSQPAEEKEEDDVQFFLENFPSCI